MWYRHRETDRGKKQRKRNERSSQREADRQTHTERMISSQYSTDTHETGRGQRHRHREIESDTHRECLPRRPFISQQTILEGNRVEKEKNLTEIIVYIL